jgi:arylsulfatase A-like enzyme
METDAAVGSVLKALEESRAATNTIVIFTSDNGPAAYVGLKELEAKGHFSAANLRGYKADAWEGGHRVPFIVRWPGIVRSGTECGQLAHQADIFRTLADVLSSKVPDNVAEDSFSLLPLLKGGNAPVRSNAVSCASRGNPAFRLGNWKYIASNEPELYNLETDLAEANNLAKAQPERLSAMQAALETLIRNGRSTPGPQQRNDVRVRRYGTER